MKQNLVLVLFLSLAAVGFSKPVRFSSTPEVALGSSEEMAFNLMFDVSEFTGSGTAYARVTVPMKITGYPLLRLFVLDEEGGKHFVAGTSPNAGHKAAFFDITDFINETLPVGQLAFRVEQAPRDGVEISFIKGRSATLTIDTEEYPRYELSEMLAPLWSSGRVINETVLAVSQRGAAADANLLFSPAGNLLVQSYELDKTYQEGVDYILDGSRIFLTEKSSIPYLTEKQLYPDSPNGEIRTMESCEGGYLIYQEGLMKDYQVAVSYEHSGEWDGPQPIADQRALPRTKDLLRNGEPIKIALLGDSISAGASASKSSPPYVPGWGELFIRGLRSRYQSDISFLNASRGGATSGWGKKVAEDFIVPERPDLCIIAFGMNDANGAPASSYGKNIQDIMEMVRSESPNAEFILVASMARNKKWRPLTFMNGYLDALNALTSDSVAVADVWSVSQYILEHKRYCEISGNHINHPNDFMVRIYAQVVGSLLFD